MTTLLDDLWRRQSVWSQAATRMKDRLARARTAALVAVVVAAVSGTTAAALTTPFPTTARWLAGVAAVASALLAVLRPFWSGTRLKDWARTRSVAEALKKEVYVALARRGAPEAEPEDTVRDRVDALLATAADLAPQLTRLAPVERPLPAVGDPASYFAVRVTSQIEAYYAPKAAGYGRILRRFRIVETTLGVVGALLGGVAVVVGTSLAAWIAVVTTVATALTTHVAASRYEYQQIEFLRTAERLRSLRDRAARPGADLIALVDQAEDAVSVENQGWMAKMSEDPPEQKRPTP